MSSGWWDEDGASFDGAPSFYCSPSLRAKFSCHVVPEGTRKLAANCLCVRGSNSKECFYMLKTILLSAAFVGASVMGAAAQSSTSSSTSPSASGANVSAATHCKDKATGQPRLR